MSLNYFPPFFLNTEFVRPSIKCHPSRPGCRPADDPTTDPSCCVQATFSGGTQRAPEVTAPRLMGWGVALEAAKGSQRQPV